MIFRHKETGDKFETDNKNLVSMLEREGYELEDEEAEEDTDNKAELIAKAKELGIKSAHSMKTETLLEKIAEIESKAE